MSSRITTRTIENMMILSLRYRIIWYCLTHQRNPAVNDHAYPSHYPVSTSQAAAPAVSTSQTQLHWAHTPARCTSLPIPSLLVAASTEQIASLRKSESSHFHCSYEDGTTARKARLGYTILLCLCWRIWADQGLRVSSGRRLGGIGLLLGCC